MKPALQRKGTMIWHLDVEPRQLTPNYVYDSHAFMIVQNVFSRLVCYDARWNIAPELAQKWEMTDDGLKYTFHLRDDVKWHDGATFTSADVKWTIESIQNTKDAATAARVQNISKVETPEDYQVVITLKEPNLGFLGDLAHPWTFMILPKHIYEGTNPADNAHYNAPIGTGAFKFVDWQRGSHVTLEAVKDHWQEGPYLEKLVYRFVANNPTGLAAVEAGEMSFTELDGFADAERLMSNPRVRVVQFAMPVLHHMDFKVTQPPFDDPRVRKAFAYAINRDEISEAVYHGLFTVAHHAYLKDIPWAFNPDARQPGFDPQKAESLLDEAGLHRGPDGVRLRFKAVVITGQGFPDMATVAQANLKKIGVEMELVQMDFGTYSEAVLNRHDAVLSLAGGFIGPYPDEWRHFIGTDGYRNPMEYSNPKVDALFKQARTARTQEEAAEAYRDIQAIIADDLPWITLVTQNYVYVTSSNLQGLWMDPEGIAQQVPYDDVRLVRFADK
ncbi:MAG TPA: ABC transporter substrate-binding protein [Anaerolineae bacterium]|nr:ABC transporter substrate-binding protein [Anaerolineae bacterium]